jgi:hypothetical protein
MDLQKPAWVERPRAGWIPNSTRDLVLEPDRQTEELWFKGSTSEIVCMTYSMTAP